MGKTDSVIDTLIVAPRVRFSGWDETPHPFDGRPRLVPRGQAERAKVVETRLQPAAEER